MIVEKYMNQSEHTRDLLASRCRTYSRDWVLQQLRMFYRNAVKTVLAVEDDGVVVDTARKCTRGIGSFRKRQRQRMRRTKDQGRRRKAPEVRAALFE